jgi:hypothetical protein
MHAYVKFSNILTGGVMFVPAHKGTTITEIT